MNYNPKQICQDGGDDNIVLDPDAGTPAAHPPALTDVSLEPLSEPTGELNDLTDAVDSFDDMGLKEDLLRGIYSYGFESPSLIQQQSIRPLASGQYDLIAQAQSGTGKTAAFCTGVLQSIDTTIHACQAIILSPTRELAKQSAAVGEALGRYMNASVLACVGGASMREQASALRRGIHLVIGTPGRILDLITRGIMPVECINVLVLDEADQMLVDGDRGFRDAVYDVLKELPRSVKIGLFSATLPPEALELASEWMPNPLKVIVKKEEITLAGIRCFYVYCGNRDEDKLPTLLDLYDQLSITQAVIFCNFKRKVEWLAKELNDHDFTCSSIHSDLSQEERTEVIDRFRSGATRVLIATDVLARGIDVQQVNLVINYDLPAGPGGTANYIHRVGRSGRFGRKGSAINLLAGTQDVAALRVIEQYYATAIDELPRDLSLLA